ncbi:unnamed protein product, partial [Didymodactylos carnosus]
MLTSTSFKKSKSTHAAKFVIIIVILFNILSAIHDLTHRRLIEDTEEERQWCIVTYQHLKWLQWLNSSLNIIQFVAPFLINIISALVIITTATRRRTTSQSRMTYCEHLNDQFHQNKHLLISPLILTLLAVPRLIISFFSGCMKSQRQPWLFFAGYFIS